MSERTIVRKLEARPEQSSLPDSHLVKVKQGERVRSDIHTNVTFMPDGQHLKQVEMLAKARKFQIESARLEQRCFFSRTMDLGWLEPDLVYGQGEEMQINLLIESPEPPERLEAFLGWCRQS